jgi:hypothetical protein
MRTQTIEPRRPMRPAFGDADPECEKAAAKVLVAVRLPSPIASDFKGSRNRDRVGLSCDA